VNEDTTKKVRCKVDNIADSIIDYLGDTFPITCTSDEFIYFPQSSLDRIDFSKWDNFSKSSIKEAEKKLSSWENELNQINITQLELSLQIDINLLNKTIKTLREQLSGVRSWETQPTFYLSMICIGLSRVIESGNADEKYYLVNKLPKLIDQAICNLKNVPLPFRDFGLKQVDDTKDYLISVLGKLPNLKNTFEALEIFKNKLQTLPTQKRYILDEGLLERVLKFHLHCNMDIHEINDILNIEIERNRRVLINEAQKIGFGDLSFREKDIPLASKKGDNTIRYIKEEIIRLSKHVMDKKLVSPDLVAACPVNIIPMPDYLSVIRTGASYSMPPRYPSRGGNFYTPFYSNNKEWRKSVQDYKMTCAHETYPGHHLLDSSRWNITRPIRRAIEQPVFYEGWACFAEELMRITYYFNEPYDRFLLAKRRLSHAIRGKVDIGIQAGEMSEKQASLYLQEIGIGERQAKVLLKKYALNPGYQVCYTIGLHKFMSLYKKYGSRNLSAFVKTILGQGEILFSDLERIFRNLSL
jgi:uncharacterized protein (DUF885 family)